MITSQGADAPGGAQDYIADGKMTRGFAFLTYPTQYGDSGVMTFMINVHDQQGRGAGRKRPRSDTEKIAPGITAFNPDPTWSEPEAAD